jgi:mannose-6-phosphate isomerase-like protein (cupin superfamily)
MAPGDAGQERVVDYTEAAAAVVAAYANVVLTRNEEQVVRMSVMTEPFHWHRHPNSDETFIVVEGTVLLQTARDRVELRAGQLYTVPAGLAHVTRPLTRRSVNLTVEQADMQTEDVDPPGSSA